MTYFWIAVFAIVVFIVIASKKSKSSSSSSSKGELSADGKKLVISAPGRSTVVLEFSSETAKIKITEGESVAFHDYTHRLYLKPNFSTKDSTYRETFTGSDSSGNIINGLGGYKTVKVMGAMWYEVNYTMYRSLADKSLVQQCCSCFIDRAGALDARIMSFVNSENRRQLGLDKVKSLGKPNFEPVEREAGDTFGGFD